MEQETKESFVLALVMRNGRPIPRAERLHRKLSMQISVWLDTAGDGHCEFTVDLPSGIIHCNDRRFDVLHDNRESPSIGRPREQEKASCDECATFRTIHSPWCVVSLSGNQNAKIAAAFLSTCHPKRGCPLRITNATTTLIRLQRRSWSRDLAWWKEFAQGRTFMPKKKQHRVRPCAVAER